MKNETPGFHFSASSPLSTQAGDPKCHSNNSGRWEQSNHGQLEFHSLCGAFSNARSSWFVPQANPPGEGSCSPYYFRRVLILLEKLARCAPLHLFFFLIFILLFPGRRTKHFCGLTFATTKIPPTLCPKVKG